MDYSDRCVENFHKLRLDALVVIGGDGTLAIAHEFHKRGIPIVGVPKTIDNDIVETTMTFGFDTAVAFATDAIDRLHTTAEAHHRVMVVEVMGRYAGWIALYAGIAGGADVVLIPEIPFDLDEGGRPHPRARTAGARASASSSSPKARIRLAASTSVVIGRRRSIASSGSAASREQVASELEALTRERGAVRRARSSAARRLAARATTACWRRASAAFAVELLQRGEFGVMTALTRRTSSRCRSNAWSDATRNVPLDGDVVRTARNCRGFRFWGLHVGQALGDSARKASRT